LARAGLDASRGTLLDNIDDNGEKNIEVVTLIVFLLFLHFVSTIARAWYAAWQGQ
jgi:hypothetical protein